MTTELKPTRIIQLQAENVKRLHAVQITPDGNMVVVGGNNAQGKSSVLDAIAMILGGKDEVPAQPIRQGETKARIIADLGDIVVQRTFTSAGGTGLTVKMKDGTPVASPQTILDRLTTKIVFDPFAFIRLAPRDRAETLRRILGLDFTALDQKKAAAFAERTVVNREVDQLRATVATMPEHKDAPEAEVSTADALAEIAKAGEHNSRHGLLKVSVEAQERAVTDLRTNLDRATKLVEEFQAKLTAALKDKDACAASHATESGKLQKLRDEYADFKPIDLTPLNEKLAAVESNNAKVRVNAARATKITEGKARKAKSDDLTRQIEGIDTEKSKLLKSAKYPIAGLSFSDSGVVYNSLPFEQASSAEQLRISVAIAAAMDPTLRVMLVRDGSLLDEQSLQLLGELAREHDLQVWVERVGKGAECSVIIEDGSVQAKS